MPNKTSIGIVESPVMVVVSGLLIASKIVSFDSGQVEVWNESVTDLFSVFEQNVNTVVMSQEVSQSWCVRVDWFVGFVDPMVWVMM